MYADGTNPATSIEKRKGTSEWLMLPIDQLIYIKDYRKRSI